MDNASIIEKLNIALSGRFDDYRGAYFFGSRLTGGFTKDSDYDVVLIFDGLEYEKQLKIAGVVSQIEYRFDVFIDCKLLTTSGNKSIEYIRENVNPIFIQRAIDSGIFYARA